MNSKSLTACMALLGCFAITALPAQAAQRVEATSSAFQELDVGSLVPQRFQSSKAAMDDWKDKGLKSPGTNSQWVRIQDKYARVQISTGKIVEIVEAPK
ncbi:RcnB family protein [Pseudomonas cichorii]|uniref:RcnB family protein n=1 Tax=Pseudomonas cichorii TaxID=36746 RepID=UPI001C8A8EF1|nr:RcnB family protein [Pseudomonas cichorii]MBX8486324.1 RcnB family protein [Pseudomonas cichorii]MBX8514080.1 RcnB family protein [Pseudomonas cichorii]MBX8532534.1 RcnB family protein [Pseudomonas cichorii]MBX8575400.1 RcnB family protein [Pseudomonas cichorii]